MNTRTTAAKVLFTELRGIIEKKHHEFFYGETHIVEVSEARRDSTGMDCVMYDDVFQEIRYRVYHKGDDSLPPCVFEVLRYYSSDAGNTRYSYSSEMWNDDSHVKGITVEKAIDFIMVLKNKVNPIRRDGSHRPSRLGKS